MSRRAFYPTAEQRGKVEEMIGYGLSEAEICPLFKNPGTGKTIDLRTFRKCFKTEIATGAAKLKAQVGQQIVATMADSTDRRNTIFVGLSGDTETDPA